MDKATANASDDFDIDPNTQKTRTKSSETNTISEKLSDFFDTPFDPLNPTTFIDAFFPKNSNSVCDSIKVSEELPNQTTSVTYIKLKEIPADVIKRISAKIKGPRGANKAANLKGILSIVSPKAKAFGAFQDSFDGSLNEKSRLVMRFIGVIFSGDFRDRFSELNRRR
jgi:hypothetical protein